MNQLLSSFFLLMIASLAISSPLNPSVEVIDRNAALEDSTPTISSTPTTTTTSSPVATKTIAGCNIQGTADVALAAKVFGKGNHTDVIACQGTCRGITACISYSYSPSTTECTLYNSWMDDFTTGDTTGYVVLSNSTGVFFSDKYPSDGSGSCYST